MPGLGIMSKIDTLRCSISGCFLIQMCGWHDVVFIVLSLLSNCTIDEPLYLFCTLKEILQINCSLQFNRNSKKPSGGIQIGTANNFVKPE